MRSASSKNLSITVCVTSIAPCVSPTKITLSSYLGFSRGPASSAWASPITRSASAASIIHSRPYQYCLCRTSNRYWLDFDTIADSLELFAIVEEGAIEASQVLQEEPATAEAERGMFPGDFLVGNYHHV